MNEIKLYHYLLAPFQLIIITVVAILMILLMSISFFIVLIVGIIEQTYKRIRFWPNKEY